MGAYTTLTVLVGTQKPLHYVQRLDTKAGHRGSKDRVPRAKDTVQKLGTKAGSKDMKVGCEGCKGHKCWA